MNAVVNGLGKERENLVELEGFRVLGKYEGKFVSLFPLVV
jgi:hypothetical protein